MKKVWHTIEKILGIYRWHPTIALRYLPIISEIKKFCLLDSDILEVGSGGLGIAPYIKHKVVGIDLNFPEPIYPELVPVKGEAQQLPFADNCFDVVISTDMLEHLSSSDRDEAVYEMLRVAKKLMCLGFPTGEEAFVQDQLLAAEYEKIHFREFNFFKEHLEMGLPDLKQVKQLIEESAHRMNKKITVTNFGTLNLGLRKWLMRGWISENPLTNFFFRKILLVMVPVLATLNSAPTYRQLIVVKIHD